MVGAAVAVIAIGATTFWVGSQIVKWLGIDNGAWGAAISIIILMAIYGAGFGAFECRSKLKRGEL
jgi:hypothetical protein